MKDLYFESPTKLKKFLENKQLLGQGFEGICYKYDDSSIKIYQKLLEDYKSPNCLYCYLKFKDMDIPNFNFIKNGVYIKENGNEYMVGTISKYVEGEVLKYDTLSYVPFDDIIRAVQNLMPSIKILAKNQIMVSDIFINNIIYKDVRFEFIDTGNYMSNWSEDEYIIYKNNLREIINEIMVGITNNYKSLIIDGFFNEINGEFNYKIDSELLTNPIYLLKGLKKSLENFCECEIKTFKDCEEKILKKVKY